ncbi:hypothetical protein MN116_002848 [Schistosoma mekongi]|uniref:Uncharacterized protein n=1 Tax=Schistosoma mekongi TaxID=38744 RepID=A0AAE1ZHS1_SCHME|nr:hypothetical protein MN116_002848 [Schistosoma mekongi]
MNTCDCPIHVDLQVTYIIQKEQITQQAKRKNISLEYLKSIHTVNTGNATISANAAGAFYKLWKFQVDLFLRQPTLATLHSVIQVLTFGMALAKLVPEEYIQKLITLSEKMETIETKFQSSGLVPKAHFFSIREVVDLSPMKMLSMIADFLLQKPGPILVILDHLVSIFPAFIMDESSLSKIIEILMCAIRMSSSQDAYSMNSGTKDSQTVSEEPAVLSLNIFNKLMTTLSSYGSKFNDLPRILLQLFDLLRAFPTTLAHSEARLCAWWHFICCLDSDLLSDGFRKNIIQNFIQLLEEFKLSDKEKASFSYFLSLLCVRSAEIGGFWLKENSARERYCVSKCDFYRWATHTIRLIDMEPRLNLSNKSITIHLLRLTGEQNFLHMIRLLLNAILPDFVEFISANVSSQTSSYDESTQLTLTNCPPVYFSPDALRIWSELIDRLVQFILNEHRVSENQSTIDIDLSTIESALLMPFWLAGSTHPNIVDGNNEKSSDIVNYLSFKDNLAISKRQYSLFLAFHQECCLLTTVPTNGWINELSAKLSTLILSYAPKVFENVNLHLISRFLRCLAQNAEIYEERGNQKDAYCSFASVKNDNQPLGQLTGLISVLNLLLLYIPWLHPPTQNESNSSPTYRVSSQEPTGHWLTSPPLISIRTQANRSIGDKSVNDIHSLNQHSNSSQVSYGLLDALDTIVSLLNNHLDGTDSVLAMFCHLESSLTRLVQCCDKAEKVVTKAGTDLDEPLLITQHRQQAKLSLEEVFICIWKKMKIVPPNVSIIDPLLMLNTIMNRYGSKVPVTTSVSTSKVSDLIHFIDPFKAMLNLSLTLCGCSDKLNESSYKSGIYTSPVQLSITYITWFIGFWNYLVNQYCVEQIKSDSSKLSNFRGYLTHAEPEVQNIVLQAFNHNKQQVSSMDCNDKNTSRRKSIPHKTPKSEPTKCRSRLSKRLSSQSPVIFENLELKMKGSSLADTLFVTTPCPERKRSHTKCRFELEKPQKSNTVTDDTSSDIRVSENTDNGKISPSPCIRPRRGRLSLVKDIDEVERIVTPVRRSFRQTENITQSAPSNFSSRRGRSRKGVDLFPPSPKPSPASGIIAEAFGIPPGTSLINESDNHNWSPSMTSPGPLPGRPLVKRRLFTGPQEASVTEDKSNNPDRLSLEATRKRHFSDSEQNVNNPSKIVTISTCGDDTCDFIFIPPPPESLKKRRRLTAHQKERFKEQSNEYKPPTYNELDISQQSCSSMSGGDSQSQPEFNLQLSVNKTCPEVSEKAESLDPQTKTEELTETSEIENTVVKTSYPLENKLEFTPIKILGNDLSSMVDSPDCVLESNSKNDPEIIQDTETTNAECESECIEEISTVLNTPDVSDGTNPSQLNESTDMPSANLPKLCTKNDEDGKVSPPTITVTIPPILTSRPNSHTLSSPLIRGTSRAQKMLALGLQKAAEQTARQKLSSGDHTYGNLLSDHSPTSTERKTTLNLLASPSRLPYSPSVNESPSGIIRNLWSKKKSHRVSFAEQPVVYTIESMHSLEQESDEDYDFNKKRIVFHPTDDNTYEDFSDLSDKSDELTNNIVKEASESNIYHDNDKKVDHRSTHMSERRTIVSPEEMSVDLDSSQNSVLLVFLCRLSITTEFHKEMPPIQLSDGNTEFGSHHRRKAASPQRRELPLIKKVVCGSKSQNFDQSSKPSKGRPLFMELLHQKAQVTSNTLKLCKSLKSDHMDKEENILAIDSEPTLIADTPLEESAVQPNSADNSATSIEETQANSDVDEDCILIEGSQNGSQVHIIEDQSIRIMNSQINQYSFSPIYVDQSSEGNIDTRKENSAPQTTISKPDNDDKQDIPSRVIYDDEAVSVCQQDTTQSKAPVTNNETNIDDNDKENQPKSTMQTIENDVEKDILDKLSQIANDLPILRPEQRRAILLEALRTFKPIMP